MPERNWAGNCTYRAQAVHHPETVDEVRELVRRSAKLRPLGSRHSFCDIADTDGDLVSLERLDEGAAVLALDEERRAAVVGGGARYAEVCRDLHRRGFAIHNLASLPHITVAGAVATATHGSGDRNGNLATAVSALEMVTADGNGVTLSRERDGDEFQGAVVGLGALGVVTRLTLDVAPSFTMRQEVYLDLPLDTAVTRFDEVMASGYSVSLFTSWREPRFEQCWVKQLANGKPAVTPAARDWFDARLAPAPLHPIGSQPAEPCTAQMGDEGPWHERLPHFRPDQVPSAGDELQSEYLLPRHHAQAALRAVADIRDRIVPVLLISEVRSVAADRLWMSTAYGRDSVAVHFTWRNNGEAVAALLPALEAALAPFEARPHWGKLFAMGGDHIAALYPRIADFRALLRKYDPAGKFRNEYVDRLVMRDG